MRTTLDLDDELLSAAAARFPPGTPKTVILEESLRRLVAGGGPVAPRRDPRVERLIAEGTLTPPTRAAPPRPESGGMPLSRILADLDSDREDR